MTSPTPPFRAARLAAGISLEAAAKVLGYKPHSLRSLECTGQLPPSKVLRAARLYGVDPIALLTKPRSGGKPGAGARAGMREGQPSSRRRGEVPESRGDRVASGG